MIASTLAIASVLFGYFSNRPFEVEITPVTCIVGGPIVLKINIINTSHLCREISLSPLQLTCPMQWKQIEDNMPSPGITSALKSNNLKPGLKLESRSSYTYYYPLHTYYSGFDDQPVTFRIHINILDERLHRVWRNSKNRSSNQVSQEPILQQHAQNVTIKAFRSNRMDFILLQMLRFISSKGVMKSDELSFVMAHIAGVCRPEFRSICVNLICSDDQTVDKPKLLMSLMNSYSDEKDRSQQMIYIVNATRSCSLKLLLYYWPTNSDGVPQLPEAFYSQVCSSKNVFLKSLACSFRPEKFDATWKCALLSELELIYPAYTEDLNLLIENLDSSVFKIRDDSYRQLVSKGQYALAPIQLKLSSIRHASPEMRSSMNRIINEINEKQVAKIELETLEILRSLANEHSNRFAADCLYHLSLNSKYSYLGIQSNDIFNKIRR